MNLSKRIEAEFQGPDKSDEIGKATLAKIKRLHYNVIGEAARFAAQAWPHKPQDGFFGRLYRGLNWFGHDSNFLDKDGNRKPDGLLIVYDDKWIEPSDSRPYAVSESYHLIAYGHLRKYPDLNSFVLEGWSGVGKKGPRNSDLTRKGFLAMLEQLKEDGALPQDPKNVENVIGPIKYPQHFKKDSPNPAPVEDLSTNNTSPKHWSERVEEEKRQKKEAESRESSRAEALQQAVKEAVDKLPYNARQELARLGNLTWNGKSLTEKDVLFSAGETTGKILIPPYEYWRGNLTISDSSSSFRSGKWKYIIREHFSLSAIGIVDPSKPEGFELTKWMGWGANGARSAGLSEEDFGEMLYQLHRDGPKKETVKIFDTDNILSSIPERNSILSSVPAPKPHPGIVVVRPPHRIGGLWSQVKPGDYDGGM